MQQLSKLLSEQKPLTIEESLKIALDVCNALAYAKQKRLLRGILTPSSIFLDKIDGKTVTKVSDFGMSKTVFSNFEMLILGNTHNTVAHYLSPEFLLRKQSNEASDVYAVGYILYECLSG